MKFAEHLAAHITPEWRKQYIQYEEMKAILYSALERAPSPETVDRAIIQRYIATFEEEFFLQTEKELAKINNFFSEKIAEASRKFGNLKTELNNYQIRSLGVASKSNLVRNRMPFTTSRQGHVRKLHELKLAFSEFYLGLILLQNYQSLNHTGFRKILKKHDKLLGTDAGAEWKSQHVDQAPFHLNKDIDRLIQETETAFTSELEKGDRQKAMKRLRVPPLNDQQSPWVTFKVGLFSGAFIVLVIMVAIACIQRLGQDEWSIVFRLFSGALIITVFIFLLGINVHGWRTSGVNHVLIFELDPRSHISEQHLIEISTVFGVLWNLSLLGFLYSDLLWVPAYAFPAGLITIMLVFLFNPLPMFYAGARFWLIRVLGRVVSAPLTHVSFAHFWLADQLTSLTPIIVDLFYVLSFYINLWYFGLSPIEANQAFYSSTTSQFVCHILGCLPAWFRFAQCCRRYRDSRDIFPHLANAGKYSTTFFAMIFQALYIFHREQYQYFYHNVYLYFWVLSLMVASFYTLIWDLRMDWGLFDTQDFLRDEIVYSSSGYYYFAIVEDILFRFSWVAKLLLMEKGLLHVVPLRAGLCLMEVFRRFVWNFFRLENEHLNNCGQFRAVRDISVAPLDSGDQDLIVQWMDGIQEVNHRGARLRKKIKNKSRKPEKLRPSLGNVLQSSSPHHLPV